MNRRNILMVVVVELDEIFHFDSIRVTWNTSRFILCLANNPDLIDPVRNPIFITSSFSFISRIRSCTHIYIFIYVCIFLYISSHHSLHFTFSFLIYLRLNHFETEIYYKMIDNILQKPACFIIIVIVSSSLPLNFYSNSKLVTIVEMRNIYQ